MTLMKYNTTRFPSIFDTIFNDWDYIFNNSYWKSINVPLVNVTENDSEYIIEALAPTLTKEDCVIEIENDTLFLKFNLQDEYDKKYIKQEFKIIDTERSFKLPQNIDSDKLGASFSNGILTITIPKKEPDKPKRKLIDIK